MEKTTGDWTYRGVKLDGYSALRWIQANICLDVPESAPREIYRYCKVGPTAYREQAATKLQRAVLVWMAHFLLQLKPLRGI